MSEQQRYLADDERAVIDALKAQGIKLPAGFGQQAHIANACFWLAEKPPGGWGETRQAVRQLDDVAGNITEEQAVAAVRTAGGKVHPDRN
jgi:O-phosphoseryl-tRNA(Cys) synthetase